MEAAAYALVGEDGHLSDDAETGQPGGWHRSRVPMAISHDGARGSPSAHATMPMTEPGSRSMRTAEQLAELILYQSVVESEEAGVRQPRGGRQQQSWARRSRKPSPTSSSVPVHSRWPGPVLWD